MNKKIKKIRRKNKFRKNKYVLLFTLCSDLNGFFFNFNGKTYFAEYMLHLF